MLYTSTCFIYMYYSSIIEKKTYYNFVYELLSLFTILSIQAIMMFVNF